MAARLSIPATPLREQQKLGSMARTASLRVR
eukprot:SAG11_NODE_19943_length_455_cov_7.283708_1_plen_30_part_10